MPFTSSLIVMPTMEAMMIPHHRDQSQNEKEPGAGEESSISFLNIVNMPCTGATSLKYFM